MKDKTKTQCGQTRNLTKSKIWMILLLEQNMMQVKHEMNQMNKSHNLHYQDQRVMPFEPFIILSNETF
jgi:hypothetical protein